ncbi:MAG TPA: hypothetical protein VL092_10805, partial [Chitinophagaceae bacterium]|nr:hypothetical protein [Chitinophagaceae bacterium]
MKNTLFLVLCLFFSTLAYTQTTDDGTSEYHIPVVFHVVHDFGQEYFSDSGFTYTIDRLNQIFNKEYADTAVIIDPYRGFIHNSDKRYIGNARISFHLATKDPSGNPTTGITRHRSYLTNAGNDYAKYEQWPPERYLNVWFVNGFDADHIGFGSFGTNPAEAALAPYYDGLVTQFYGSVFYRLMVPELGRMLGLKYVFGDNRIPGTACGDDGIDDTPPTKGHTTTGGCLDVTKLYDTTCIYSHGVELNKPRIDSLKRTDGSYAVISDTATGSGISFECRTASMLDSFSFYPAAPVGSEYKIGLARDGVPVDSITVISTVENTVQHVAAGFSIPAAPKSSRYTLYFISNPGALKDTFLTTSYSKGVPGSVLTTEESAGNYYNFFYDWKITHGYFRIYAGDSLVDYPDTVNAHNAMDLMYCAQMFTYGQVMKMRETLRPATGTRYQWSTAENLSATGALDATPAMKPKAEILVDRAMHTLGIK